MSVGSEYADLLYLCKALNVFFTNLQGCGTGMSSGICCQVDSRYFGFFTTRKTRCCVAQDGGVGMEEKVPPPPPPVPRKKRICIEATDPEVKLPAGHDSQGWVALEGKRLVANSRYGYGLHDRGRRPKSVKGCACSLAVCAASDVEMMSGTGAAGDSKVRRKRRSYRSNRVADGRL